MGQEKIYQGNISSLEADRRRRIRDGLPELGLTGACDQRTIAARGPQSLVAAS